MPALQLDAALVHQNRGDDRGNGQFLGPDLYFDDLMLQAAPTGAGSCRVERIVDTDGHRQGGRASTRAASAA